MIPYFVQYRVIWLSELDGQGILDAGHEGLIAFAPLMRPPAGMASRAWLRHCNHTAHARPMAASNKADYLAGVSLLSGLAYAPDTIFDIASTEGIMDLIRESSFARYLTRQGIEQGIERGIERAIEQGIERGIEQGIEAGHRAEAIEQGLRDSILAVLAIRFDLPASHPLAARVETIDDVQRLKALLRTAVQVSSLDAFGQRLDEEQN